MNFLLQGDKGYTVPEMFSALLASDLEFVGMVNWWQWDLIALFKPDLPETLANLLSEMTVEKQLHLFELLHPCHRLLDFCCGHPNQVQNFIPISEWTLSDWKEAQVHLQHQLRTPKLKEKLIRCITQLKPFEISKQLLTPQKPVFLDTTTAACLLLLWEESQSMSSLLERYQQLRPVHPVTLEPTAPAEALDLMLQTLTRLENLGYVLLEHCPST